MKLVQDHVKERQRDGKVRRHKAQRRWVFAERKKEYGWEAAAGY
jgi:hypothetical protein